ncbi:hypothetical protein BJ165DRAFT_179133 [Panaeolus papilionaceus]|nr:hypothetical protein BJ165DRAFT_179133 [Panaeolus papilionaceus]
MFPVFSGPDSKRKINLGGTSTQHSSADLLNQVAAERERRLEAKRRWESAVVIQSWWRGRREAGRVRAELVGLVRGGEAKGGEGMDVEMSEGERGGEIRKLRAVVVANWGGKSALGGVVLGEWCVGVLRSGQDAVYAPAMNGNSQSWFVLLCRIAKMMLSSVALSPESENSIQYLTVLNYLLSRDAAVSVLGDEGAQLCQKMTDHLINNGLYTSLSQAVKQIPVESKSSPALPHILSLITLPLTTSSPSPALLLSIFTHILTIPLLPNRLPLSALPTFTSRLPFTSLHTLGGDLIEAVKKMGVEDKVHFLANMSMFVNPGAGYKRMGSEAFVRYLEVSTVVINEIPRAALEKRPGEDGRKAKKVKEGKTKKMTGKRKLLGGAGEATSASEGSRPQTPSPSSTRVVVVQEFSQPPSSLPQLVLDSKTQARILKLTSPTHLQAIFEGRQGKEYGKTLNALVGYLFALSVMVGGGGASVATSSIGGVGAGGATGKGVGGAGAGVGKDKDKDKPPSGGVLQFLAGGGAGAGFVRELWRECVRGSPLGREGEGSAGLLFGELLLAMMLNFR